MADTRLRTLERSRETPEEEAAYLVVRMRSGKLTREQIELLAYLGDEGARLVLDWGERNLPVGTVYSVPRGSFGGALGAANCMEADKDLATFIDTLRVAVKPLPNVTGKGERNCLTCSGTGWRQNPLLPRETPCRDCTLMSAHGNVSRHGRVPYETPAPRYALILAAHAAGREVFPKWERLIMDDDHTVGGNSRPGETRQHTLDRLVEEDLERRRQVQVEPVRNALGACHEWLQCPCEEHEKACWVSREILDACCSPSAQWATWWYGALSLVFHYTDLRFAESVISSAACVIGSDRVRSVASKALIRWVINGEVAIRNQEKESCVHKSSAR